MLLAITIYTILKLTLVMSAHTQKRLFTIILS